MNSVVSQYPNEVGVDFVILKHRWRRKQIAEEVAEAEKEVLPFIAFGRPAFEANVEIAFGAKLSKKAEPPRHDVVGEEVSKGRLSSAILAPDQQIFLVQRLGGAKATIGGSILAEADGAKMRSKSGVRPAELTAGISDRIWDFLLVVAVAWPVDMNTEEAEKHLDASGVQLGCYVAVEELMNS